MNPEDEAVQDVDLPVEDDRPVNEEGLVEPVVTVDAGGDPAPEPVEEPSEPLDDVATPTSDPVQPTEPSADPEDNE